MPTSIRLIVDDIPSAPAWNMAVDEALWLSLQQGRGAPTLRLYAWDRVAVSIGRLQTLSREVNLEACRADGVAVVRRPTAGGAVLHGHDVTFSLAVPEEFGELPSGVLPSYRRLHEGLIDALAPLGLRAELTDSAERSAGPELAAPCFARPTRHDVLLDGRKIIGGAQRRGQGALLHQGTVCLSWRGTDARYLLKAASHAAHGAPGAASGTTGTTAWSDQRIAEAVIQGCEAAMGVAVHRGALSDDELRSAQTLQRERYGTPAWTAGSDSTLADRIPSIIPS